MCPLWQFAADRLVAFVLMEPVTASTHRWVMHGSAGGCTAATTAPTRPRWEPNDSFPVMFAAIVMIGLWLGFNLAGFAALVPMASASRSTAPRTRSSTTCTSTAGSLRSATAPRPSSTLAAAHRIHHLQRCPVRHVVAGRTCRELRARAARTERDPFADVDTPAVAGRV